MSQTAGVIRRIFDRAYRASSSGIRRGVALIFGADETQCALASTANAPGIGVCADSGSLPDGTAVTTTGAEDRPTAQKAGLAAVLVPASTTIALGDQAVNDSSGKFTKRTRYSISAWIWGFFAQSRTVGSNPELLEAELHPHQIEIVRPVTGGAVGVLTAATVWATAPGQAKSTNPLPLYRARFAGETVRNLSVNLATAPGGADTVVATVKKSSNNGGSWSTTGVTCTISAAAKSATDLSNTFALAAGDLVGLEFVSSAGTAADATGTFDIT